MATIKRTRTKVLMLRLNDEERALLEALAADMALALSQAMRQAIRAEARRRGIRLPPTKRGMRGAKR